jgi:hypothetical protein
MLARNTLVTFVGNGIQAIFAWTMDAWRTATNVHQILKLAPLREHGYMYIASVEGPPRQRMWRCAMKDCQNVIVDDAPPN